MFSITCIILIGIKYHLQLVARMVVECLIWAKLILQLVDKHAGVGMNEHPGLTQMNTYSQMRASVLQRTSVAILIVMTEACGAR